MASRYNYLIIGAGPFGSVCAHELTKSGKKCLVIDKRNHIGGNTYCEEIAGISVHKYGPHIFGGRLAEYKYYDMDKIIKSALDRVHLELKK